MGIQRVILPRIVEIKRLLWLVARDVERQDRCRYGYARNQKSKNLMCMKNRVLIQRKMLQSAHRNGIFQERRTMHAKASIRRSRLQGPNPLVKPHEWERRKAQIKQRHPDKDADFYQDPKTGLWTLSTTCLKTGEVKIVATHAKPFSALHFGMEKLVTGPIIRRSLRPGITQSAVSEAPPTRPHVLVPTA